MRMRIIGILGVMVLTVTIILAYNVYVDSNNSEEIRSLVEFESSNANIISVDSNTISRDTNDYDSKSFDFDAETIINLSYDNTTVQGSNVTVSDNTITISSGGSYRVTGNLSNGRIIVNAPKQFVKIILDNASIKCDYSSPLFIYKSKTTMIYLEDGSTNYLEDGNEYTYNDEYSSSEDEEPNATLYSKSDLVITGEGSLVVNANYNNGITSKDTLIIDGSTIEVTSNNNGINGKDSNTIKNATIKVVSSGDAIRSTNDSDETLGWISIENSTIEIIAGEDGIQAETDLIIDGGIFNITTGEGSSSSKKVNNNEFGRDKWGVNSKDNTSSDNSETSRKGLKAGRYLVIKNESTININSSDDAVHSNTSIQIDSGTFEIKAGDDGIHADNTVTINNGIIKISESYEGIEGDNIVINDGNIDIVSSDDGINISGGADGSGFGGFNNLDKSSFGGKVNIEDRNNNSGDSSYRNGFEGGKGRKQNRFGEQPSGDMMTFEDFGGPNMQERPDRMEQPRYGVPQGFEPNEQPKGNMPQIFGNSEQSKEEMPPMKDDFSQRANSSGEKYTVIDINNTIDKKSNSTNKLIINGGTISVNANGDGLDSNGSIEINGGYIIVQGPTNSGNGALDYQNSLTLSGGTVIAIGASGMAQGIKTTGNQGSIMTNLNGAQSANTKIELKDENDNTVLSATSEKTFNNIVLTSPDVQVGSTYKIYLNGEFATSVEASQDTSKTGFGSGMRGGFGR